MVTGQEERLEFEPMEPDFRLHIGPPWSLWVPEDNEETEEAPPADDDLFEVLAVIDLEQAARHRGYGGEGPAIHLVLERAELRRFLKALRAEHAALGEPPETLVPTDK